MDTENPDYDLGHANIYPEGGYFQHEEPVAPKPKVAAPEVDPGMWELMQRYGHELGDMAHKEWQDVKARGVKQNAIDYAKGAASNIPMLVGMPADTLDLFRSAMPPRDSGNPYANSLRGLLDKYLGTGEDPLYGSEFWTLGTKDLGLDLEGEGLGYMAGNMLGAGALLKQKRLRDGVLNIIRDMRAPPQRVERHIFDDLQ